jgi:glycosyltransferase involved in cell wall biosynthesis
MSQAKPLLTIGMPVYNGEKFIAEAIEALLAQSFTDFQLVVSDNCSTDKTKYICQHYYEKDPRVKLFLQKNNVGPAKNFISLLEQCSTEYFMWAAADDLWHPSFIASCIKELETEKSANFAMTNFRATSMMCSFFDFQPNKSLEFIRIKDTRNRIIDYAKRDFREHKDNLVYSIWRSSFISKIIYDVSRVIGEDKSIGGAMNDLVLLRSPGVLIKNVMFFKRYKKIVPGSNIDKLLNWRISNKQNRNGANELMRDIELLHYEYNNDLTMIDEVLKVHRWSILKNKI